MATVHCGPWTALPVVSFHFASFLFGCIFSSVFGSVRKEALNKSHGEGSVSQSQHAMIYNILFLCFYLSFCISLISCMPHKPCQDRLFPVNQGIYTSRPSIYNFDILFTVEFKAADCCWSSTLAFSRNSFRKIFPAALSVEVGHQMSETSGQYTVAAHTDLFGMASIRIQPPRSCL